MRERSAGTDWIVPSWPAPPSVGALATTRNGGTSEGPWRGASGGGMNLGLGSGDAAATVHANRAVLAARLPATPVWLEQVHGVRVVDAGAHHAGSIVADASFATRPGIACAILVADCMPVLFSDRRGSRVAAAHAGWRGLLGGVLEATLDAAGFDPVETMVWIGPAIGPTRFEVGDDVRDAFRASAGAAIDAVDACFIARGGGKWLADLPALARERLGRRGVVDVYASGLCTAIDERRFYSYRRDRVTGRMAALVWTDH